MRGELLKDADACVEEILRRLGKRLVVGLPLGLGKPNHLVNALYRRAAREPGLSLRLLTALTLEKPAPTQPLEQAFLGPILARLFGDYEDLDYIVDLRRGRLPKNVEVCEFFFRPGALLDNAGAQQNYISSNYTHAARDVFAQGCNLALQLVARREVDGVARLSLSCNPDTSIELLRMMRGAQARGERTCLAVAQVHRELPYMFHDAELAQDAFDLVLDNPAYDRRLFGTIKDPVGDADYQIGLTASSLIADGGTLQIGIGALGDAIVHGAILRNRDNARYRQLLADSGVLERHGAAIEAIGGTAPFARGLYGASEMFVDGFLHLYRAGILRRRVYDFVPLQRLLSDEGAGEDVTPEMLERMAADGVGPLRADDVAALQRYGVLSADCRFEAPDIVAADGERIPADLSLPDSRRRLAASCLGRRLQNGVVLHGAFFLGPNDFYRALRDMPDAARSDIAMCGVERINQLDLDPVLFKLQRRDARLMNTGLMATLNGAIVSDGLEDGRVLSGVGGQYNFVAMAHQLPGGRSVLMVRAVRELADGTASSNIVWNYGHCTIPRHLRDIVVTEYGIAQLRSQCDRDVIKAMLNIADSRFQPGLLAQAQRAGKVEAGYRIPEPFRNNTPERLRAALKPYRDAGDLPAFPFGTDLTEQELLLGKALKGVKARASRGRLSALRDACSVRAIPAAAQPFLERLGLADARGLQNRIAQRLLVRELMDAGAI